MRASVRHRSRANGAPIHSHGVPDFFAGGNRLGKNEEDAIADNLCLIESKFNRVEMAAMPKAPSLN